MNNKYVAIGLSIFAVVLVFYQLVLRKDKNKVQLRKRPAVVKTQQAPIRQIPAPMPAPNQNNVLVDFNSEILLKEVYENLPEPYQKREILTLFGENIFQKSIYQPPTEEKNKTHYEEVEYHLNAIILDDTRKLTIINGKILKEGDFILGAKVITIEKSRVTLFFNQQSIVLSTNSKIKRIRMIGGNRET